MSRHRILALAVLGGLVLSGCFGTSPTSRFYTLQPIERPTSGAPSSNLAISVALVEFPSMLARPQMVMRQGNHEVLVMEFARWAEPLENALPRILATNIGITLGSDRVSPVSAGPAVPDGILRVYVQRFDVTSGGAAVLEARWRLVDANRDLVMTGADRFEAAPVSDETGALVSALNRTLNDLSGALARDIAAHQGQLGNGSGRE